MSILPGLRDLRTPLAAGYAWLAVIILGGYTFGWKIPTVRPESGSLQYVWDVASSIGRVGVLAAMSFIAFLLGSFVEMSTENAWGRLASSRISSALLSKDYYSESKLHSVEAELTRINAQNVRASLSDRAIVDLSQYISLQTGKLDTQEPVYAPKHVALLANVLDEFPHIATRLLVKSPTLYERYDRLLAEAAFRLNAAPPLTALGLLCVFPLPITQWQRVLLILVVILSGATLLRQGGLRALRARDALVQALVIGDLDLQSNAIREGVDPGALLDNVCIRDPKSLRSRLRTYLPPSLLPAMVACAAALIIAIVTVASGEPGYFRDDAPVTLILSIIAAMMAFPAVLNRIRERRLRSAQEKLRSPIGSFDSEQQTKANGVDAEQ